MAEVCKDAHQFVVADACRVVQEVELPRTARAIPVLFAAVGGECSGACGMGGAVDGVVRLAVAADEVGGDVIVALGVFLPGAHGFFECFQRQPLFLFQFFAVGFFARFPVF